MIHDTVVCGVQNVIGCHGNRTPSPRKEEMGQGMGHLTGLELLFLLPALLLLLGSETQAAFFLEAILRYPDSIFRFTGHTDFCPHSRILSLLPLL